MGVIHFAKTSPHPYQICKTLQQQLEEARSDPSLSYPTMQKLRNRPTLLVIDRTFDIIAPLIHEFTYQAMAYDLLNLKNDIFAYKILNQEKEEEEMEAHLNENDLVWMTIKHKHIKDVSEYIRTQLIEFKEKYESVAKIDRKEKANSLVEMNRAVKNVTAYNEEKQKFAIHSRIVDECLDKFSERNLNTIGNIEQDLACGTDPFGDKVSHSQIKSQMKPLWSQADALNEIDKLRLLMMYCLYFSVGVKDRVKLAKDAGLSESATEALHKIMKIQPPWLPSERKKKRPKPASDETRPYDLSRRKPRIVELIPPFLDSNLSSKEYSPLPDVEGFEGYKASGYVKERKRDGSKSLKCRKQPSWAEKNGKVERKVETKLGDRFILYIMGGVTYSELREISAFVKEKESDLTIITCVMSNPTQFVNTIKYLQIPN